MSCSTISPSTYFEGKGPTQLGAHGHSRDGKPRNPQVLVGLVLVDGWPIAHHVFAGNRRDAMTVPDVVQDLEQRFGIKRIVLVGDRGMVTSKNLDELRSGGHGYIVGRNRRRSGEIFDYIQSATGAWIECPCGITAGEKPTPPKTLVQEVASNKPGVRVFVVHSEERLAFEQAQRVKAMDRVRSKLDKLTRRVASGKLKAPEKIGAAAAAILARHHGHRYYDWCYEDGVLRFFEHPLHFTREKAYEGKYVIQTEETGLSAVEAVRFYKDLAEVERSFGNLTLDGKTFNQPRYPHCDAVGKFEYPCTDLILIEIRWPSQWQGRGETGQQPSERYIIAPARQLDRLRIDQQGRYRSKARALPLGCQHRRVVFQDRSREAE